MWRLTAMIVLMMGEVISIDIAAASQKLISVFRLQVRALHDITFEIVVHLSRQVEYRRRAMSP
jgi:hypothetical protein